MRTGAIMTVKNLAPIGNIGGAQKYLTYCALFFSVSYHGYLVYFFCLFLYCSTVNI